MSPNSTTTDLDRRIDHALDLAIRYGARAAESTVRGIGSRWDAEGLFLAMVRWVDALDGQPPDPVVDTRPEYGWAAKATAACQARDREAWDALMDHPDGPAQVRDHVMALLDVVASSLHTR